MSDTVQESPEGHGGLVDVFLPCEGGYVAGEEDPEIFARSGLLLPGGARQEKELIQVGVFAGEGEVGAGDAADGFFRVGFPNDTQDRGMEDARYLAGESFLKGGAVGEVSIERVGRELKRGCKGTERETAEALLIELLDGGREDGLAVGLGWVRHVIHCTP